MPKDNNKVQEGHIKPLPEIEITLELAEKIKKAKTVPLSASGDRAPPQFDYQSPVVKAPGIPPKVVVIVSGSGEITTDNPNFRVVRRV